MLPDAIVRARPGPGAALDVVAARDPTRTASVARMTVMLRSRMAPPPPMASDEDGPTVATGHAAHIDGTPQPHAGITLMTAAAVGVRMRRAVPNDRARRTGRDRSWT